MISVIDGSIQYKNQPMLITDININLSSGQHISINGNNGSGKSSLIKALMRCEDIITDGKWILPSAQTTIGYLDQNYATLNYNKSVFDNIADIAHGWDKEQIRQHLNDFLFRKNEEINALADTLSGGERARLSLCRIAANPPELLILDEITNNLDLETKEHMVQVLIEYPEAMIVISHEQEFLDAINIDCFYKINNNKLLDPIIKKHLINA